MNIQQKAHFSLIGSFILNTSIEITILLWESRIYIFVNGGIIRNLNDRMDSNFMMKFKQFPVIGINSLAKKFPRDDIM